MSPYLFSPSKSLLFYEIHTNNVLVHDEYQVDDDIDQRLEEQHQEEAHHAREAAEHLRTDGGTYQLATQYERIPVIYTVIQNDGFH